MPTSRPPRVRRSTRRAAARLDQLRVLAHPLRLRLYELFAQGPRTTKQAATQLGQPVTRLYHHVAALERVGLLKLRETRPIRGTVEKYFEVATHRLAVEARALIDPASPRAGRKRGVSADAVRGQAGFAALMFDRAREESLAALATLRDDCDPARLPILARAVLPLTDAQVPRVRRVITAFLQRLMPERGATPRRAPTSRWALTLAFLPSGAVHPQGRRRRRG